MLARWLAATMLFAGCESAAPAPAVVVEDVGRKPRPGDPCTTRSDCDDGVFCSGVEECLAGSCVSARNAACRAPSTCASATCDESGGACVFTAKSCESGQTCSIDRGCESGACTSDAGCDDGRSCTDDVCVGGQCAHLPIDARCPARGCGVGVCLGDAISDPSGCATKPDAARCKVNEGCVDEVCVALAGTCASDADCADGTLCDGVERCVGGACVHGGRTTCVAGPCQHASCSATGVGDPWCRVVTLARCP